MKAVLKWLGRIAAGALTLVLVIVLTPYAATLADVILPDISGAHIRSAAILSQQLEDSARLETMVVTGEGVVSAEVDALIFGTVSSVNASYTYTGSYGVDLSRVQLQLSGSTLTFILPQPEVLSDDITIVDIYRDGILDRAVRIDDTELQALLNAERQRWRDEYLSGEQAQALRDATIRAFEATITQWMSQTNSRLEYRFVWAE